MITGTLVNIGSLEVSEYQENAANLYIFILLLEGRDHHPNGAFGEKSQTTQIKIALKDNIPTHLPDML